MEEGPEMAPHLDLLWLLRDALGLLNLLRKPPALLLLLCAIDALAGREYPKMKVGPRFKKYLRKRLSKYTGVTDFLVKIQGHEEPLRLEDILYKYLRCPMIHEGLVLDMRHASNVPLLLDWSDNRQGYVQVDESGTVIIGADGVINALVNIVSEAVGA